MLDKADTLTDVPCLRIQLVKEERIV